MSSSKLMPVVTMPRMTAEVPSQPPETFLRNVSDSHLDKLYDLPEDIQDVIGLQALRPSAALCKVMTIPNSKCVRIVTPDEHVSTGFHEILIHDMGQEEWPQVTLSDIGCLRLDWLKDLFAFVGRYQLELEQMRKACRDRFGPASSGACPTCDKYIKVSLGKHVALYHLDLAQLWRCPVPWCPVWKHHTTVWTTCEGTQHTRHGEGWKPGSMVSTMDSHSRTVAQYEQAIRIRNSHRHVLVQSHWDAVVPSVPSFFRGPYMTRLFDFLKEADAESIRRSHRRRAKEIAASMSNKELPDTTTSSRRSVQRTPVSKITGREAGPSLIPTAERCPKLLASSIYRRSAEKDTVQALMDLSLPLFTKLDDGMIPKTKPWPVAVNSPASPTSAEDGNRTRTPSPCMDLDELSTDGSVTDVSPQDFKVTLLYDSEDSCTPVFSSDEDLPLSPGQEDRRKVRKRVPPVSGQTLK